MDAPTSERLPRIGFLGTGWIGLNRLEAILRSGEAEVVGIADTSPENAAAAARAVPEAQVVPSLDELLALELDGLVIATPSAGHCLQAVRALDRGVAVFCQKPLARTRGETRMVVDAARRADRLLAVDFSYRFTEGIRKIHQLVTAGDLGNIYAADLVFHNAYGPDKDWFYRAEESGGGCLMDLGSHLVDLALWLSGFPEVMMVSSSIFAGGRPLDPSTGGVEDYALASMTLANGTMVRLACSWNVSAGQDAVISTTLFGTRGGACFRNVNGSFYDFVAERYHGTSRESLAAPPDAWGGRAAVDWARRLRGGERFSEDAEKLVAVAETLDVIYGRNR